MSEEPKDTEYTSVTDWELRVYQKFGQPVGVARRDGADFLVYKNNIGGQDHVIWVERREIDVALGKLANLPLTAEAVIIPAAKTSEGVLIKSTSILWEEVIRELSTDWTKAYTIPPQKWEELIAGAYSRAGFDEVILTPRSGDYGRDVIATKRGIGCIKIIGSVKAYKAGHLVKHDDVRAFLHVLNAERDTSKGIFTTTSSFAPRIKTDPFIAPYLPTRLELIDGKELQAWLSELIGDNE